MLPHARFAPAEPHPNPSDAALGEPTSSQRASGWKGGRRRSTTLRLTGAFVLLAALTVVLVLSVLVGTKPIPLDTLLPHLLHHDGSDDANIVRGLRVPRTLAGLLVGLCLGLAGALMQAVTRNPLADPLLLGVGSGAAAGVVLAVSLFGITATSGYVWFAFLGAALASVAVYALGSAGRGGATPVRLILAGTAMSAALAGFTQVVVRLDVDAFDTIRAWSVGSLAATERSTVVGIAPFVAVGTVLALALARPLNALTLGEDTAAALGGRPGRTRVLGALAIALLCGAATAAAGPIGFVGLTVPHVARLLGGTDHRWVLTYSLLLAPVLLVGADIIGRVVTRPGELQVAIVTAVLGAPVFIALVRRHRLAEL